MKQTKHEQSSVTHKKNCNCGTCQILRSAGTPDKPGKINGVIGYKTGGKGW